jgi:hypothetical protein
VLNAATKKLFFGTQFNPKDEDHVFAALAFRVGLEIGESEASMRLATEAVRSHMRILTGIAGPLIVTAAPSEPILAIAAATALNASTQTYKDAIETLLDKLILNGLILDRGLQGELYTRLLLILARDKAATLHGGKFVKDDPITHVPGVQPVRLSHFLQTLLGQNLGIRSDNVEQSLLRTLLLEDTSQVWINFTHFVQLSVSVDEVTPLMMYEAWSSGFAFQCAFHQPLIDGFIVAYSGRLDEPFDISKFFLIPWQSKATAEASALALAKQLTAPFILEDNSVRRKPLHVVILMDLAASSAFNHASGPHCDLTFGQAERPPKTENKNANGSSWDGYARDDEQEAERYCLNIRGHRSQTYPVLKGFETQFDQLFQRELTCARPEFVPYAKAMEQAMDKTRV